MAIITYVAHDGGRQSVDASNGRNLMETAVAAGVSGIDGDCGGVCACATCHVRVDDAWLAVVGSASGMEAEMLEMIDGVGPNSRLACQIIVSDALDGAIVATPETQGY